jgi:hypothetical protein
MTNAEDFKYVSKKAEEINNYIDQFTKQQGLQRFLGGSFKNASSFETYTLSNNTLNTNHMSDQETKVYERIEKLWKKSSELLAVATIKMRDRSVEITNFSNNSLTVKTLPLLVNHNLNLQAMKERKLNSREGARQKSQSLASYNDIDITRMNINNSNVLNKRKKMINYL